MKEFLLIFVLAITVEALVQYGKTFLKMLEDKQYKVAVTQLGAVVLAVILCFATGADVYALLGITFSVPWLGILLSGIFASRGSNYLADIIKRLQNPPFEDIILDDDLSFSTDIPTAYSSGVPPSVK